MAWCIFDRFLYFLLKNRLRVLITGTRTPFTGGADSAAGAPDGLAGTLGRVAWTGSEAGNFEADLGGRAAS